MKRPGSKALYTYLSERGLLHAPDEVQAEAKRAYRKEYKQHWRKGRPPQKSLRPTITLREYILLKQVAREAGFNNPTAYVKQMVIASITKEYLIPNRDVLLGALQHLSIGINRGFLGNQDDLKIAESILLEYLHIKQQRL